MHPTTNQTVLVVDDDDEIRHLVRGVLDREGYHVLDTGDGDDAIRMAEADRPALVLLDLSMPGRDGLSVASELRNRGGKDAPVVVALSARHLPSDREKALAAGCSLFLAKPCPPSRLRQTVATLLAQDRQIGS